jgi:beta-glucosidase/6-phospho-beta-glucosidase/beta-galactosidase
MNPHSVDPSFKSFFLAGFECSSHLRRDGRRLDLLESTGHDRLASNDYRLIAEQNIHVARDGLRWHRIETTPGHYDWSSFLPMLRAAQDRGIQVIWDLCHYGWPDDIDIWSADFPERFAAFAGAAARIIKEETGAPPFVCPVNEISFWAWAGADVGQFAPCAQGRGLELKRQLVRAAIAGTAAVREVDPNARFICAEPLIHVDPGANTDPNHVAAAEHYRRAQFEATDLLTGRLEPELGGQPDYLDIVGVNFYPDNQWYYGGPTIPLGHHAYRPLQEMLTEWFERYGRPMLIAETGAEGSARPAWLHYVCAEVQAARAEGVPIEGACLYPVLEYSGWENDRHCFTGLLSAPDAAGARRVFAPLATEIRRQQIAFAAETKPLLIAAE